MRFRFLGPPAQACPGTLRAKLISLRAAPAKGLYIAHFTLLFARSILMKRVLGACLLGAVVVATGSLVSCSQKERPPNHPLMGIHDRNASRIELVELIVQDKVRAKKVKAKYIEIETLVKERAAARAEYSANLLPLTQAHEFSEEKVRAAIERSVAEGQGIYLRYISIQLAIRKLVTREGFSQLDGVR